MNYLVIGGAGFLGSYICKQLTEEEHTVVCADLNPDNNVLDQIMWSNDMPGLSKVVCDITDPSSVSALFSGMQYHAVIVCAALLKDACEEQISLAVKTNILGLINVFEAARAAGVKRVVYTSADTGSAGKASDIFMPDNLYGMTKYMDEFLGDLYNRKYQMETVGIRYTLIYGMGRTRGTAGWLNNLTTAPALGIPSLVQNGNRKLNCIYVKDAARLAVMAADAKVLHRSVYEAAGDYIRVRKMRNYVQALVPETPLEIHFQESDISFRKMDPEPERKDLGFVPEYNYESGLLETINNIRMNRGLDPL